MPPASPVYQPFAGDPSSTIPGQPLTCPVCGAPAIAGEAGYCAAKFGVIGLTKAAALDYAAQNIRVNAVCSGYVDTPMMQRFTGGTPEGWQKVLGNVPVGRPASPDEIAGTVLWLCSDAAAYVIGQALVVDGGQTVL